jgi:preprotein translocase subunit Sec61beta
MAKKKQSGSGLQSSAGLMRYYEADETAYAIDPKYIVILGIAAGIVVLLFNIQFGLWP